MYPYALECDEIFLVYRASHANTSDSLSVSIIKDEIQVLQLESNEDKIYGVANTSGTENQTVQVYVPNVQ